VEITIPHNWRPRPYQLPLWDYLRGGGKRALVFWHRRAGKDDVALHWSACSSLMRPATYWHMLPEAAQARRAVWEAVNPHSGMRRIDETFPHPMRAATREQDMQIKVVSGSSWHLVGSDNYNSLVGSPPFGMVASEWALANPAAWGYIQPILEENGGWGAFITTPRGKNHAFTMLQMARDRGWFTEVLRADQTGIFTDTQLRGIQEELIGTYGHDMGTAMFEQEYLCSFDAGIIGSYWGGELALADREGRIGSHPVDPALPVHTAWDLGVGTHLAIWFWQSTAGRIRVVDFYQSNDGSIEAAAAAIIAKGYPRGHDYVPHDAKAREISTGRTPIETLIRAGLRPRLVADHSVDDGINAARITIGRTYFHAPACGNGIEALKAYRRNWDDKLKTLADRPVHDWASHPADAFRYLAMAWHEMAGIATGPEDRFVEVGPGNAMTLNDLWDQQPTHRARL